MEKEELGVTNLVEAKSQMNFEKVEYHSNKNEQVLIKGQINETEINSSNIEIIRMDSQIKIPNESLSGISVQNNAVSEVVDTDNLKTNQRDDISRTENENPMDDTKELTENNNEKKEKHISKIDFTVFEESFYRRYKSFFHNDKDVAQIDLSQEKSIISKKINEHFSNFEINPVDVIRTFLVLRKNSEHSHGLIVSPAQSPEPSLLTVSEGNGRGKRCAPKDINTINTENSIDANVNGDNISSFKNNYKTENNSNIAENNVVNHTDNGVSTRNSRKGRVSNRGRR